MRETTGVIRVTRETTKTPAGDAPADSRMQTRVAAWRGRAFGPASELPYRRRTSDVVRLIVTLTLLVLAILHQGNPSSLEENLFKLVNGLPDQLETFFTLLYRLGALWALGLIVLAALVARRWRLGRDLLIAGVAAWVVGRLVGTLVVTDSSVLHSLDVVTRFGESTPNFPVVRLAMISAVISVAAPYLTRPVRRTGQLLVLLLAVASLYLGTGLPDAAFAALVLGWGIASSVHLAFGSPGGRPTSLQVEVALEELGLGSPDVHLTDPQPRNGTSMEGHDDVGPLSVRVLGRDEADAQLAAKSWRFVAYKDAGPGVHLTRLGEVEHEAYVVLLAERAGVRVPSVVVAGEAGPGAALLVSRPLDGVSLAEVDVERVTDAVLADLWHQVGALHAAHVAHGTLNARRILLTAEGIALTGFDAATGRATAIERSGDVAELLFSTAEIVGDDRAVAAARGGIGDAAVIEALPLLQPAALSGEVRPTDPRARKAFHKRVGDVRNAAAAATNTEAPPLQQLHRVSGTNLMMAIGTLFAISVLLSQVGDPQTLWDTVTSADPWWLTAAMLVSFATNCATAIALMGTVPIALPLWRTSELQLSMSFSNLAIPAVGGMAAQIRFLQKQGVDLASAVASGGLLINVGNILANAVLLGIAIALSPATFRAQSIPVSEIVQVVVLAVIALAVVAGLAFGIPRLRRMVLPPIKSATITILAATRSPKRVALLLGGNAINAIMYGVVMACCIEAFGGSINFFTLLALNIFIGTIASLVPIPGGNTAVSTVGMSGALTAFGVSTEVAVAAVLANQLVANYIPAIPGWFATNDMLHHDYL